MTSVLAAPAQIPANKLYTNILNAGNSITDTFGNVVPWVSTTAVVSTSLGTPGGAILRDMGKTVYQPNPSNYNILGSQSTIYRKVQLVTQAGEAGYYGTGGGNDLAYYTGYICLGGQTYGGGNGTGSTGVQPWVRLN
jgi:hypothetical protein